MPFRPKSGLQILPSPDLFRPCTLPSPTLFPF
jgi:hypothetical protein